MIPTQSAAARDRLDPPTPTRRGGVRDLVTAGCAVLFFAAAALVGRHIEDTKHTLHLAWPPIFASWEPHLGPGTPAAVIVAVAVVAYGPRVAERLSWRALLWAAWGTSMAWTWSLALIDGWHRGVARRLTTRYEYLQSIDRFDHIGAALRDFTHHILLHTPQHWPAHVAGHPPGAVLTFVGLDRIGLGGGGWAAVFVLTTGTSAATAVLVALRALTREKLARAAAPFLVLAPAAVWAGVSADGYYAAVGAWSVALLALAATGRGRRRVAAALGSGLLFGLLCYLSYGLVLYAAVIAAVLLLTRTARPLPWFVAGAAVVPLCFTLAGFDWWEAYHLLVTRYYQGAGGERPYGYFLWSNLACTVLIAGLAAVAGLGRAIPAAPGAVRNWWRGDKRDGDGRLVVIVLVGLAMILAADLSGMSKAETERIWQPFALWLLPAAALLPVRGRRGWLAAGAVAALVVNHLLFTGW